MPDENDSDTAVEEEAEEIIEMFQEVEAEKQEVDLEDPEEDEMDEDEANEIIEQAMDSDDGDDEDGEFEFSMEDQMDDMMGMDAGFLPEDLDGCLVEVEEEEETEEDGDEDGEEDAENPFEGCEGTTGAGLQTLGHRGDVTVTVDSISASTVNASEQPGPDTEADIEENVENFIASLDSGLEIHFDDGDDQTVHNAIGETMEPTKDQLRRDPDKEITPENLYKTEFNSCHDDYDYARTFNVAREGDADRLGDRGPWTNRRFNVQDLIDALASKSYESEDGILVVFGACPMK